MGILNNYNIFGNNNNCINNIEPNLNNRKMILRIKPKNKNIEYDVDLEEDSSDSNLNMNYIKNNDNVNNNNGLKVIRVHPKKENINKFIKRKIVILKYKMILNERTY